MTTELTAQHSTNGELADIEASARAAFDEACYVAQAEWYNENQRIHAAFSDNLEDNNARYRQALTRAQRAYRDATADVYR